MDKNVKRVLVEKRNGFDLEARALKKDIEESLHITSVDSLRVLNRYDVEGISDEVFQNAANSIFSEPNLDVVYFEEVPCNENERVFAVEYLPGQYDQRADWAAQCIRILNQGMRPELKSAKEYILSGNITDEEFNKIKGYIINPVDSREAGLEKSESLALVTEKPTEVEILDGFIELDEEGLNDFVKSQGLAMTLEDLKHVQVYFRDDEHRNPTITEIKVLDTYWSDHCRHTTFMTELENVEIAEGKYTDAIKETFDDYMNTRKEIYVDRKKDVCLMDIATLAMKKLKKEGKLADLDESEEINACSINVDVEIDGKPEKYLVMFKNETHNHPTEIEPLGGAATCLGGAIRDPLSGRAYVYQSMRITGSGDPRQSLQDTLEGKLPQKKITREAAHGFSSYGNQIGLTTGYVHEIYDEGYIAKRMEVGAVVAAAPKEQVKRLVPQPGNIVLLIGGRTGRDGVGGATGSSKAHNTQSITTAGAEVQKGNPVEERKIQRLFRNKEVSEKIIRCNDFGAGGVSVAVGELAEGLDINLDAVLKKYEGLNGTELAISESQERMAIVIDVKDRAFIEQACYDENLEVVQVATVTDQKRLVMHHQGQVIVDLKRSFVDAAGAKRYQDIHVALPDFNETPFKGDVQASFKDNLLNTMGDLACCSQKGLVERFDSSIGNATVLSPFGGKYYGTETEGMAALVPVLDNETTTASLMAYGFDPTISTWSPYHGAMYAIVESVAKIVAMGGDYSRIRFSFQEYFEKLLNDPHKWGNPLAALLGAFKVQKALNLPSIGGKDSMSGTFNDIHVPPTLVSFAITTQEVDGIVTPEFKQAGHKVVEFMLAKDEYHIFNFDHLKSQYAKLHQWIQEGRIVSCYTVKHGGLLEAVAKSCFGNRIGFEFDTNLSLDDLMERNYGHIICELADDEGEMLLPADLRMIGYTIDEQAILYKTEKVELAEVYESYTTPLEDIFPTTAKATTTEVKVQDCNERTTLVAKQYIEHPHVTIPVFPGTNCEYDSKRAFEKAGATVELVLIRNKRVGDIEKSIDELEAAIKRSQIVMLPGGFSAGDEPEGSGKFIATVLRNEKLKAAIHELLNERDGLMIGICNGFQALIKLGLLPDGEIRDMHSDDATLTFNTISRHLSQMVTTRISSVKSPWLDFVNVGDTHIIPISHGEGRFVASEEKIQSLFDNGQVFTQYVDENFQPTMESPYNPNGSMYAIEGIISKDGRVLGKMGHSERQGENRFKNIYGPMDQKIFEAGVNYYRKGKK